MLSIGRTLFFTKDFSEKRMHERMIKIYIRVKEWDGLPHTVVFFYRIYHIGGCCSESEG